MCVGVAAAGVFLQGFIAREFRLEMNDVFFQMFLYLCIAIFFIWIIPDKFSIWVKMHNKLLWSLMSPASLRFPGIDYTAAFSNT